ncbi:MAG TPA: YfiR family protein [Vicinamibacterales bacterium]|nr:YfiR family protein [Vicinamibacterales bacterium]
MTRRRTFCGALVALVMLALPTDLAIAARVSTPELKAAFLLNFVRFAEWPGDVVPAPARVLCVLGDDQVEESLEVTVKRRTESGRDDIVKRVSPDGRTPTCHLLYISGVAAKQSTALLKTLSTMPTLTVSDLPDFAQSGGIVNFIVEDDRMRFVINTDAADRARLRLSSKLLSLATIVKDQPVGIRR